MTKQEVKRITAMFTDILYMVDDDIFFCDKSICPHPCMLVWNFVNSFSIISNTYNTQPIINFSMESDRNAIEYGICHSNIYNSFSMDSFPQETLLKFFRLNLDVSYRKSPNLAELYDMTGIRRIETIKNIIND